MSAEPATEFGRALRNQLDEDRPYEIETNVALILAIEDEAHAAGRREAIEDIKPGMDTMLALIGFHCEGCDGHDGPPAALASEPLR